MFSLKVARCLNFAENFDHVPAPIMLVRFFVARGVTRGASLIIPNH